MGQLRNNASVILTIVLTMDPRPDLFADKNETSATALPIEKAKPVGIARVQKSNRNQLQLCPSDLEFLLLKGGRRRRRACRDYRVCPGDSVRAVARCGSYSGAATNPAVGVVLLS